MYRVLIYLVLAVIFLTGCQVDNNSSSTPKEALEQIHINEGYAEVVEIYESIDIDEGRIISVYKGILNNDEEIFVANIEKEDDLWKVTDAINIGMPSPESLGQSSTTESFQAGYIDGKSKPKENVKLIEMNDSDYKVWIEVD